MHYDWLWDSLSLTSCQIMKMINKKPRYPLTPYRMFSTDLYGRKPIRNPRIPPVTVSRLYFFVPSSASLMMPVHRSGSAVV